MHKPLSLFLFAAVVMLSACAPRPAAAPSLPTAQAPAAQATQAPTGTAPAAVEPAALWKPYTNSAFGFSFQYPSAWFGPDEYVSDQTLRLAVGSDVVYPYGTSREEQVYTLRNAYAVTIQYSQHDQNQSWQDTYQALANLQDGESLSSARSVQIKVRQLSLGRFQGIEFISTLAETAQTEPVYIRQVILMDDQSNLLTVMGAPNNVEVSSGAGWREAYQKVDEENLDLFHHIVESISVD